MELVTDAFPSQRSTPRIDFNIDHEVLKNIEKELQDYEKLSLLWLILDDYNCFTQVHSLFRNNEENILSSWVGKIPNWQTKFFEALCITKARRIVRLLGKKFHELELIYVPICMDTDPQSSKSCKVHLGAKLLFNLFDQVLDEKQRENLLKKIYQEIEPPQELQDDDEMEKHALYWVNTGFITLAKDGYGDFQNLLKPLKELGLFDHPRYLDLQKYTDNSREHFKKIRKNSQSRPEPNPPSQLEKSPEIPSNVIKNPRIIIFNVITVQRTDYESRDSSYVDVDKLRSTFRGLGYDDVDVHDDPTSKMIRKTLQDLRTFERSKNDGVIVCILSHGVQGHFVSHDNVEVPLAYIDSSLCIPQLQGLPKIVMVQACQGNKIGRAIETNPKIGDLVADGPVEDDGEKSVNTLNHDQFLLFSSTMKDCKAIRHMRDGSWFIEAVCEVLRKPKEGPHLSVHKWTQGVKNLVRDNRGELKKGLIASQLPEVTADRFVADYFFPIFQSGKQ